MIGSRRTGGGLPTVGGRRLAPPTTNFGPQLGGNIRGGAYMPTRPPPGGQMPGANKPNPQPGPNFMPVNPNSLLEGGDGRNPMQHQDWWAAHGWNLNPGGERFSRVATLSPMGRRTGLPGGMKGPVGNGPGGGHDLFPHPPNLGGGHDNPGGGGGPHAGNGNGNGNHHGGPGGHGGPGNGHGGPGRAGLPMDPYFEAQRRQLEDQLQATLQPLRSAREQVMASNGLQQARMDTNQGVDTDQLLNAMAARGIFGSGIQAHDQGQLSTDYLRQNQDLANATAGSLGDIASQRSAANLNYHDQLMEALLASAQRSNADKYAVAPIGGGGKHNGKKGHHGRQGHHGKHGRRTNKARHDAMGARR